MNKVIVFAGSGGQGIILLTRIIGSLLVEKGYSVISTETHGMATRGGSVLSFMKIGDFESPFVRYKSADICVLLDDDEYKNVEPFINDMTLLISCSLSGVKLYDFSARGHIPYRNLNMLACGVLAAILGIPLDDVVRKVSEFGKARKENLEAIKLGYVEVNKYVPAKT